MSSTWEMLSELIEQQPMPSEFSDSRVDILCNDCQKKTLDLPFHFVGHECENCGSYNTRVLSSRKMPSAISRSTEQMLRELNNNNNNSNNVTTNDANNSTDTDADVDVNDSESDNEDENDQDESKNKEEDGSREIDRDKDSL